MTFAIAKLARKKDFGAWTGFEPVASANCEGHIFIPFVLPQFTLFHSVNKKTNKQVNFSVCVSGLLLIKNYAIALS